MVTGGLAGEEPGKETVTTGSEANSKYIQGWGGARLSDVGNDIFPPKREGGGHRGIGPMELVWKVCAAVLNYRLKRSVILHDALHGFREGRGMGTATLEANLAQQLAGLAHKPLFQMFLDDRKACDSMDMERCMEIMWGYGMFQNMA